MDGGDGSANQFLMILWADGGSIKTMNRLYALWQSGIGLIKFCFHGLFWLTCEFDLNGLDNFFIRSVIQSGG
jgi:hypothetical protein